MTGQALPRYHRGADARQSMLRSSFGLLVGKGLQIGAGFLFWVVAARTVTTHDVGLTAAAVSAIMLCSQLASMGAGSAVIVAVGRRRPVRETLDTAFTVTAAAGAVVAVTYLVAFPSIEDESATLAAAAVFVVAVVAGTVAIVVDQGQVALGRGDSSAVRYAVGGVVMLAAVFVIPLAAPQATGTFLLLACWSLGAAAVAATGAIQLWRGTGYRFHVDGQIRRWRGLLGIGLPNQLLTLSERAPGLVLPVLLAYVVSPTTAAYWYPAWMMAWAAYSAPMLTGIVQFAEGVRAPDRMHRTASRGLAWSLGAGLAIALTLVLAAGPLLHLLGREYAEQSAGALRILALGLLPYAILHTYNATCRTLGRLREATVAGTVLAVLLCLVPLGVAGTGVVAVAAAWVSVLAAASLLLGVRLLALLRGGRS